MIGQRLDPTGEIAIIPAIEGRPGDAEFAQCAPCRQMRGFDQADDLRLLGCGVPHVSSSPSASMLFLAGGFPGSDRPRPPSAPAPHGAAPSPRRRSQRAPYRRPADACRRRGTPSTSHNTSTRRSLRAGTARRCSPHRARLPARYGSSLRPKTAAASLGGYPSQPALPVLSPARISVSSALHDGYDDPEILPSRKPLNCLKSADGGHRPVATLP